MTNNEKQVYSCYLRDVQRLNAEMKVVPPSRWEPCSGFIRDEVLPTKVDSDGAYERLQRRHTTCPCLVSPGPARTTSRRLRHRP